MANPTLSSYFGASAQVLTSSTSVDATSGNPAIVLRFGDFSTEGLSDTASATDPDKLLAAIIKKVYAWTQSDTSEDPGTEVTAPSKSFTSRNGSQKIAWLFYVSFFTPDTTSSTPDPDDVV